jgi:NADPH2 dehydrogenase
MTNVNAKLIIRGNEIKNRIVMAPMVPLTLHGDNGSYYGTQHVEHYTNRAKGGAGLIIQANGVLGASLGTDNWTVDNIAVLKKIADSVHKYECKIIMQLSCGDVDSNDLTLEDIHSIQEDMKQAAITSCNMGYDGVEYHFAHGYTLCKFMDSDYNKRTDNYGGSIESRVRILIEILENVRKCTHEKFIISVRMSAFTSSLEEGIQTAKYLEECGIDLISVSYGIKMPEIEIPKDFICSPTTYSGVLIKKAIHIPVIVVNEIRTAEQVNYLIENGHADLVAIGRGMLADEEFANHVLQDKAVNMCFNCGKSMFKCQWFVDHTKCPARKNK